LENYAAKNEKNIHFLQKALVKSVIMVNISRRPMIIRSTIVTFAVPLKWAKLPMLPEAPRPGPTHEIDAADAPAASSAGMPVIRRIIVPAMKMTM
jgi:hypothetical protein